MFCVKCGTQVNDGRTFCPNCGSPLPGAQQQQYAQQAQYAQQQQYAQQAQYAQQQYQQYQAAPQYRQPVYQQPVQGGPLDVKRLILAIILFLMAVASILTFCFKIFTANVTGINVIGVSGYGVMTGALSGASKLSNYLSNYLDTYSPFDETLIVIGIVILWILFAIALGVLVLTVLNLLGVILRRNILKANMNVFKLTVIGVGVVALVYVIIGAVLTISINSEIDKMLMSSSSSYGYYDFSDLFNRSDYLQIYTSSYWPAIIQILLIAAYVIVDKTVKAQPAAARAVRGAQPGQAPAAYAATPRKRNVDVVEEIKKYKELYDMGAITWEEFEAKKKELLM